MDGTHAQLQLITSEENLAEEEELLITSNKHSAACTVVEQAVNCAPNFKLSKKLKTMKVPHQSANPIVLYLKKKLDDLEKNNFLKLRPHTKKQ